MKIEAITVNFALADQDGLQTLERIDYELKLNDAGAGLTGTARLMVAISSDLEGAEPISEPGELIETFSIKGAKISTVATSSIVQP